VQESRTLSLPEALKNWYRQFSGIANSAFGAHSKVCLSPPGSQIVHEPWP
jgi:hypothetical protein